MNRADTEVKGDWARSGELLVDGQMAAVFQGKPFMGEDGQLTQAAWRQASDGRWWYDYGDGPGRQTAGGDSGEMVFL